VLDDGMKEMNANDRGTHDGKLWRQRIQEQVLRFNEEKENQYIL
jgi:hypothetical protein